MKRSSPSTRARSTGRARASRQGGRAHTGEEHLQRIAALEAELAVYRQALEKTREEMQGFTYSVSHDLRAPLRAIEGFSKILMEDFSSELSPDALRFLQHIIANTQQLGGLVEDLLRLHRLTKNPPNKSIVDADAICKAALTDLEGEYPASHSIHQEPLPPAWADPAQLREIFRELLSNAMKFTRKTPGGNIQISARNEPGALIFSIADNGEGFDPANGNRLFQVFQKIHSTDHPGNGIGLAIVKRLVEAHGGCVSATGAPGAGAVFSFTLPRSNGTLAHETPTAELCQSEPA